MIHLSTHWTRRSAMREVRAIQADQLEAAQRGGPTAVLIVNGWSIGCDDIVFQRRRGRGDWRREVMAVPR